jgi:hypothetical protein
MNMFNVHSEKYRKVQRWSWSCFSDSLVYYGLDDFPNCRNIQCLRPNNLAGSWPKGFKIVLLNL